MKDKDAVFGIHARAPRPTLGALKLLLVWIGLPILGLLFGLDLLLWSFGIWPYGG